MGRCRLYHTRICLCGLPNEPILHRINFIDYCNSMLYTNNFNDETISRYKWARTVGVEYDEALLERLDLPWSAVARNTTTFQIISSQRKMSGIVVTVKCLCLNWIWFLLLCCYSIGSTLGNEGHVVSDPDGGDPHPGGSDGESHGNGSHHEERFQVGKFDFAYVKTPFIVGVWILYATAAKLCKFKHRLIWFDFK